ncbi:protein FAM173B-like isoform X3 [Sinocyclocheilus grahami]|uniref:protein FAM173B-like isoform X2 n=1 Tax=Sinocyclocheilus grahami TaxID=75366 RepID=UPI0007ACC05C|nr:PREDICTED: protein FAM173B-like isoform X2 [Sinocyclocheilus grahami]XP_016147011.1 PREDICTED: protein FAM173B-like isoform X3 [Sinocyclocheilus grahami]
MHWHAKVLWRIQWRSSFSIKVASSPIILRKSHLSQQHLALCLWEFMASGHYLHFLVFGKCPYVSRTQTQNVMKLLHGRAGCLADLGSGDGRLVFTATVEGFQCTGFEINSILTGYARVKAKWKGIPSSTATFINQDFWKTDLSKYNNVTVFLAPGVMEVLGRKLEKELPDEARVIACRFPFPDWTPTATEGEGQDQTWAYDMNAIRKLSTQATMR